MEPENISCDPRVEQRAADENSAKLSNVDVVKNVVAKKLHGVAGELSERAEFHELQPIIGDYGKQAAYWLDQSAEFIQNFDYRELNARVREYVSENPGISMLVAGVAGLVLGALVRRR